jgi:hypothetical protein
MINHPTWWVVVVAELLLPVECEARIALQGKPPRFRLDLKFFVTDI